MPVLTVSLGLSPIAIYSIPDSVELIIRVGTPCQVLQTKVKGLVIKVPYER